MLFSRKIQGHKQHKNTASARITNIATLAVSIGIAAIILAASTSKGLQKEIQKKTSVFNGHILVTLFENNESQVSVIPLKDNSDLRNKLKSVKNISNLHPIILKAGMLKSNSEFEGVLFKGVSSEFDWSILKSFIIEGAFPKLSKDISNEILISKNIADRLSLELGSKIQGYFQNQSSNKIPSRRIFTVSGIYSSGFPDIDDNLVYLDLLQLQKLNRWKKNDIGAFEIFVDKYSDIEKTSDFIYNEIPSDLNSIPINRRFSGIYQWIALFDFNVLIILFVMLIVGIINMATNLLVLILERSRMIGLLKAIGAQNITIQKIFLYSGAQIMLRGLFYGNLVGLGFYFAQKYFGIIKLDPTTYFVDIAPVYISVLEVFFLNLLFLTISLLILWIPSRIILKISPSNVLRLR